MRNYISTAKQQRLEFQIRTPALIRVHVLLVLLQLGADFCVRVLTQRQPERGVLQRSGLVHCGAELRGVALDHRGRVGDGFEGIADGDTLDGGVRVRGVGVDLVRFLSAPGTSGSLETVGEEVARLEDEDLEKERLVEG